VLLLTCEARLLSWPDTPAAPSLTFPARFFHRFLTTPPPSVKEDLSLDAMAPKRLPRLEPSLRASLPLSSRRRGRIRSYSDDDDDDLVSTGDMLATFSGVPRATSARDRSFEVG
jgi:hypothetical protein